MKKRVLTVLALTMALYGCSADPASSNANNSASNSALAVSSVSSESENSTDAASENNTKAAGNADASASDNNNNAAGNADASASDNNNNAAGNADTSTSSSDTVSSKTEVSSDTASVDSGENSDPFAGIYVEDVAYRGSIEVNSNGNGGYNVLVHWPVSANEYVDWTFSGEFNGRQVLDYSDCTKTVYTYHEDGTLTTDTEYTNGTGYIRISEEGTKTGLVWSDDKENAGGEAFFAKN